MNFKINRMKFERTTPSDLRLLAALDPAVEKYLSDLIARARTDYLTGLGNRSAFDDALEREYAQAYRAAGPIYIALKMADLDDLKGINTREGHQGGDEAIRKVGVVYKGLRRSDIAFRLSGDEFAAIMRNTTDEQAVGVAGKLARMAREQGISMSFGIASRLLEPGRGRYDPSGDIAAFVKEADEALYAVKNSGQKGRIAVSRYGDITLYNV